MYQAHWGLDETPFQNRLDRRYFYESPTHEEALARLQFLVDQHRRLGLLLGEHGSGKSLLLGVIGDELRSRGAVAANLSLSGIDRPEFLESLATGLQSNPTAGLDLASLWRLVTDRVLTFRYQQLDTVLLLDDIDQASPEVLAQVARLARFDLTPETRLTIVLAGREDRMARLGQALLELVELRIDVARWEPADTAAYLTTSLAQVGRQTPLFDDRAIARLHELSDGIPRRISQLADLALLAGAGDALDHIPAETIESVYRELATI